jgi:hypothetical protein
VKLVRVYTGEDNESHFEEQPLDFGETGRTAPQLSDGVSITFAERKEGAFSDFHHGPERQYVFYLTCTVEIGAGDGSKVVMEPGDVLLAQDNTGHGHTSRVLASGVCAFVRLNPLRRAAIEERSRP